MIELTNIKFLTKGHRGIIFKARYRGKEVIIKQKNPKSKALSSLKNEAKWLKILANYNIGPKLIAITNNFIVCEYICGEPIVEFLKKHNKKKIKRILQNILDQLFILDSLCINKEEMHRPIKHIIIRKDTPILIDFERCHKTKKPKNVTQFCQFLMSDNIQQILKDKGIRIDKKKTINICKLYKKYKIPFRIEELGEW